MAKNGNLAAQSQLLKAAGVIYAEAVTGDKVSEIRQIQDQADTFYISGHGNHATGQVLGGEIDADSVKPCWNQDLDTVIIVCSVLDINNYNNKFTGTNHTASPGEKWAESGPKLLFGYNATAPLDDNVGDLNYTKEIITKYLQSTETDPIKRWMYANRDVPWRMAQHPTT